MSLKLALRLLHRGFLFTATHRPFFIARGAVPFQNDSVALDGLLEPYCTWETAFGTSFRDAKNDGRVRQCEALKN
jgi:hypothetical protein